MMGWQDPPSSPFAAGTIDRTRRPAPNVYRPIQAPVDFIESFNLNQDDATQTRNSGVREFETLEELWSRHHAAEAAMGHRLPLSSTLASGQPDEERDSLKRALERIIPTDRINAWIMGRPGTLTDDEYEQRLDALRAEHPDAMAGIETREAIRERLSAEWYAVRRRADDASSSGIEGGAGAFAGQVWGTLRDPPNAAVAVLTGGAGAGKSLAQRVLIQGGMGAGLEALQVPDRAADAARYGGPEYAAGEAFSDVLFGGAAGAGFEVAGDLARQLARPATRALTGDPVARALADEIERTSRAWASDSPTPEVRGAAFRLDAIERDQATIGLRGGEDFEAARFALDTFDAAPVAPWRAGDAAFADRPAREALALSRLDEGVSARIGADRAILLAEHAGHTPRLQGRIADLLADTPPLVVRTADQPDGPGVDLAALSVVREALFSDTLDATGWTPGGLSAADLRARASLRASTLAAITEDADLRMKLAKMADAIDTGGAAMARTDDEIVSGVEAAVSSVVERMLLAAEPGALDPFTALARGTADGRIKPEAATAQAVDLLRGAADAGDALATERRALLAPKAPDALTARQLDLFTEPGGKGQAGQVTPKPEDADLEAGQVPGGVFADLDGPDPIERAIERLRPCAPGRA